MMLQPAVFQAALLALFPFAATAQETAIPGPQCADFASNYSLSSLQISRANISTVTANNVEITLNFERTNWATGDVRSDPFYHVPANYSSSIPPGTLLAVEDVTNTSLYTLPAAVSLSRFTYQSRTVNGTGVPASAYVLWPYLAREFPNITGVPTIVWGHGTSGVLPDCAPSHIRNLWYQYSTPYILALQGYAVVAPDYVGLGVGSTKPFSTTTTSSSSNTSTSPEDDEGSGDGSDVRHPWLLGPSQGLDLLHALPAARAAFPGLSAEYVVMGHSQGGTAAWNAAALAAVTPVAFPGYLGAVAGSPGPGGEDLLALLELGRQARSAQVPYGAAGMLAQFPDLPENYFFTEEGIKRWRLFEQLGGCSSVASALFATPGVEYVHANFTTTWAARRFAALGDYAGRGVRGPLLVLAGIADPLVSFASITAAVNRTCDAYPRSSVALVAFEGVGHVPTMYAGQRVWLDWIADRFAGVPVEEGCARRNYTGVRDVGDYLKDFNYFLEPVTNAYQVA